jgi:hypothetical protein
MAPEVDAAELGAVLLVERPPTFTRLLMIVLGALSLVFDVAVLGGVGLAIADNLSNGRPRSGATVAFIAALGVFGGVVALFTRMAWRRLLRWLPDPTVTLHERGLSYETRRTRLTVPWSAVDEVVFGRKQLHHPYGTATNEYRLVVHARSGATIRISESMKSVAAIAERARAAVLENELSNARRRRSAHEAVGFGDCRVDDDGVVLRSKRLPWYRIDGAHLDEQLVVVRLEGGRGKRRSEWTMNVPNADVFVALIREGVVDHRTRRP